MQENVFFEVQVVLQGKSRNVILRELQRTVIQFCYIQN